MSESEMVITLPEGHNWQDADDSMLRGNEYAWLCTDCGERLYGVMDVDGFAFLDVEDIEPCVEEGDDHV